MSPLTRDDHLALAPLVVTLRRGLILLPLTWGKSSRSTTRLKRIELAVDQLRLKLDKLWLKSGNRTSLYHDYRVEVLPAISEHVETMPPVEFAKWLRSELFEPIREHISGRAVSCKTVLAVVKVDQLFSGIELIVDEEVQRPRRYGFVVQAERNARTRK